MKQFIITEISQTGQTTIHTGDTVTLAAVVAAIGALNGGGVVTPPSGPPPDPTAGNFSLLEARYGFEVDPELKNEYNAGYKSWSDVVASMDRRAGNTTDPGQTVTDAMIDALAEQYHIEIDDSDRDAAKSGALTWAQLVARTKDRATNPT